MIARYAIQNTVKCQMAQAGTLLVRPCCHEAVQDDCSEDAFKNVHEDETVVVCYATRVNEGHAKRQRLAKHTGASLARGPEENEKGETDKQIGKHERAG